MDVWWAHSESEPRLGHFAISWIARQDQLVPWGKLWWECGLAVGRILLRGESVDGKSLTDRQRGTTTGLIEDMFKRGVTGPLLLGLVFCGLFSFLTLGWEKGKVYEARDRGGGSVRDWVGPCFLPHLCARNTSSFGSIDGAEIPLWILAA